MEQGALISTLALVLAIGLAKGVNVTHAQTAQLEPSESS